MYEVTFFWYVKDCIFWKGIQYTIHWDKTQMLKNFPSDKISGTENALFFLSRAPFHHSFTFDLRFLYELKRKVSLTLCVGLIFHFDSVSLLFLYCLSLYFCSTKCMNSLTFRRHNSFQNYQNNRKATRSFAPRPLIFKLQQ